MSQEIPDSRSCATRTRRVYSAQFKAELIAACQQPGASIAATAREHGMNANVLHRWLKEHRQVPAPDRMRYGACCCVWHRPAVRRCSW